MSIVRDLADARAQLDDPCALGVAQFGGTAREIGAPDLPYCRIGQPSLDVHDALEIWAGSSPASALAIESEGVRVQCRHNGEVLFGVVRAALTDDQDPIAAATLACHRAMLQCLRETDYPYLLRIWNSIPGINAVDAGLERYRRFNLQRHDAFLNDGVPIQLGAPAASALGTVDDALILRFLAVRQPVLPIENPRQVSAYAYPTLYGPKAPNFSRAALWPATATAPSQLFISGTASIVGHETQHVGDVVAQTHELLRNVSVLVERAAAAAAAPMTLADLTVNAYVRHAEDLGRVREVLVAQGFDMARVLFLQADICRTELLVEIEAMGAFSDVNRTDIGRQP